MPRKKKMDDVDKEIDRLINNYSKLDLAQMVMERDSSIETLNEIIEKMKCCDNCIQHRFCGDILECKIGDCDNYERWKLKEA
jgi:hypothetical protein